jgi:hypothetical protein
MDLLLFPGGILGAVFFLVFYLRKQKKSKYRSITGRVEAIVKSNLTPAEDIAKGYAAVAASMRQLRAAKQQEHSLLAGNWKRDYMALLPDTDPEKSTYMAQLQGVKIQTAAFELDSNGMKITAGTITASHLSAKYIAGYPVVEDGPEWVPLGVPPRGWSRKEPEELSYSQRRIQSAGAFVRCAPNTKASTYGVAEGGSIMQFDGYVHGEPVNGNPVWFVYTGKGSGLLKYVHSIATTDRSTSGLPNLLNLGKYNPVPKEFIPSTLRKTWY